MRPWYETETHYFHAPACDVKTIGAPLPEGTLQMAAPAANCCKKVRKKWDELPEAWKEFVRGIDKLGRKT